MNGDNFSWHNSRPPRKQIEPKFAMCKICVEHSDYRQYPTEDLFPFDNIYLCKKHFEEINAKHVEERTRKYQF